MFHIKDRNGEVIADQQGHPFVYSTRELAQIAADVFNKRLAKKRRLVYVSDPNAVDLRPLLT